MNDYFTKQQERVTKSKAGYTIYNVQSSITIFLICCANEVFPLLRFRRLNWGHKTGPDPTHGWTMDDVLGRLVPDLPLAAEAGDFTVAESAHSFRHQLYSRQFQQQAVCRLSRTVNAL